MRRNQGFSIVEGIIIVVVIAVIGALGVVGYNAWKNNGTTQQATTNTTSKPTTARVPDVKSTGDLDTVAKTLDNANVSAGDSDTQQLSTQASGF